MELIDRRSSGALLPGKLLFLFGSMTSFSIFTWLSNRISFTVSPSPSFTSLGQGRKDADMGRSMCWNTRMEWGYELMLKEGGIGLCTEIKEAVMSLRYESKRSDMNSESKENLRGWDKSMCWNQRRLGQVLCQLSAYVVRCRGWDKAMYWMYEWQNVSKLTFYT